MEPFSDIPPIPQPRIVSDITRRGPIVQAVKPRQLWRLGSLEDLMRRFSPGERLLLYIFTLILGLSTLVLLIGVNRAISVSVPAAGGSLSEGETSPARFINPVLAISQADQDLTSLIFSGLMRATPDGSFIPDLASSYSISADGTTYTFMLRPDATFHDGSPVTADDVLFTIGLAQNPDIKSPRRADWEGVSVSAPDAHTIIFTLPHAYAPFIEDTTLGILPKHLWQNITAEEFPFTPLNTHPVGTGPYKIRTINTDSTGSATRYDLEPFARFALGPALLSRISFLFFPNENALLKAYNERHLDTVAAISSSELTSITRKDGAIVRAPLPRVFGIFLNQNHNPVLADASVRAALDAALDKDAIVKNVLGGFGTTLTGPIPPGVLGNPAAAMPMSMKGMSLIASTTPDASRADLARAVLQKGGWSTAATSSIWTKKKMPPLSIKLATADSPELVATADLVAAQWQAAGINVSVQVYPLSEFNNTILRPREYDAVLFGEVVGRDADLFAFWHSSQRNDPGLNLALYTNAKADTLLTDARATTNRRERDKLYEEFAGLITKDQPVVFLYAPEFIYLLPSGLSGVEIGALTTPAERFLNVYQWHTGEEHVWSFFTDKTNP